MLNKYLLELENLVELFVLKILVFQLIEFLSVLLFV